MRRRIHLHGMIIDALDEVGVLDTMFSALAEGRGGWIVTANLDILRRATRDREAGELYAHADLCVADGMPLVWASSIQGTPLPARVAGSTLASSIAARAEVEGRSLFLLGGQSGSAVGAREVLQFRHPRLAVCGIASPTISAPPTPAEIDTAAAQLAAAAPDIVYVALGSPKQEYLARALRELFPRTWFIGVGISLSFLSGQLLRAPLWMQRLGLEWVHRLVQEPRRLARRYLVDDLPFALLLFARALAARLRRSGRVEIHAPAQAEVVASEPPEPADSRRSRPLKRLRTGESTQPRID